MTQGLPTGPNRGKDMPWPREALMTGPVCNACSAAKRLRPCRAGCSLTRVAAWVAVLWLSGRCHSARKATLTPVSQENVGGEEKWQTCGSEVDEACHCLTPVV